MSQFSPSGAGDYGQFFTPAATADFMLDLAGPISSDAKVLEPAAGEGVFVERLLARGVAPQQITAWEFDPEMVERLRARFPGVKVEQRDSLLDTDLTQEQRFDLIVGNPPYLNKRSAYVRAHRDQLQRRYGRFVGAGETFTMFSYLAMELLAADGQLLFIVGDTIRTLPTHQKLRELALREYQLHSLVFAPKRLFADASVQTSIFHLRRHAPSPADKVRVLASVQSEADFRTDNPAWHEIPQADMLAVDGAPWLLEDPRSIVALFRQPLRLGEWVDSHIGMHTRDNIHALAALENSKLAESYLRRSAAPEQWRVISAAEAADRSRWVAYLKEGGEKDFWAPAVEFLDWDPARRAGYVMPRSATLLGQAGIAVSGISGRLSARVMPAGSYWDTNKVFGLIPKQEQDRDWLLGLLCSDLYTYIAKRLLNDSSSLQLSDLWKLPVPQLSADAQREIAAQAAACVRAVKEEKPLEKSRLELNRAVYQALQISPEDQQQVVAWLRSRGLRGWTETQD